MRTRIAMNEAIDSHEDASATDDIVQAIDPRAELVRLLDSHGDSVVRRLHAEKVAKDGVLPFASPRDPAAVLAGLRPAMDRIASWAATPFGWQKARPDPQPHFGWQKARPDPQPRPPTVTAVADGERERRGLAFFLPRGDFPRGFEG